MGARGGGPHAGGGGPHARGGGPHARGGDLHAGGGDLHAGGGGLHAGGGGLHARDRRRVAAEDFGKVFSDGRRNMTHTPDVQPAQAKAKGAAGDVQLLLCRCTTRCSTCTTAARSFRNKIKGSTITGRRLRLARQHTELAECAAWWGVTSPLERCCPTV